YHLPPVFTTGERQFLAFLGACRGVYGKVRVNGKSSEKALVKRFCEKNFTEFLLDLKKWSAFLSSAISWKRFLRRKTQNFAVK
ncbi:MAG: hypothetical protein J6A61_03740, partial [Clostridia bacterium]|nr:hypothetical protein [Clostridia bacterium]